MALMDLVDEHLAALEAALGALSPEQLSGPDAASVVQRGVRIERLGVSVRTRYARRVTATGAYEQTGHKNAAGWLAELSGESVGQSLGVLETAAHLSQAPMVEEAFSTGKLSLAQAKVAAEAGAMDPSAQEELVGSAAKESFKDLKDRAQRVKRRKEGESSVAEKEARAHKGRYLRTWVGPEGGMKLEAWLPTVEGARVRSVLEKEADLVFHEARAAGTREPPDRYLADALVRVACGAAKSEPKCEVAVRVDLAALRRGQVQGDEVCEIPGIGPIPVAAAKDLLGDSLFRLVVADGVDVRSVTSNKRTIRSPLRSALLERDRTCAVPGCTASRHLQIDHDWDFAKGGPTELDNLHRLCPQHHAMKTYRGFRLVGEPGNLRWVGPTAPSEPAGSRDGPTNQSALFS